MAPQPLTTTFAAVAMRSGGYRVLNQTGDVVVRMPGSSLDQLSFTTNAKSAYIELADVNGSRIVRASDGTSILTDAESPAVSADGTHFAFIRERKGTGSLWELDAQEPPEAPSRFLPRPLITDPHYDVRAASFFHSDDILFVAQHSRKLRLFLLQPGHGPVPFIETTHEIGAIAVSPDQRFIAVTELIKNRWQLAVLNIGSRRHTVLTLGDCNAFTPAWMSPTTIIYATDCGRAYGLTGLASIDLNTEVVGLVAR
jgi:Tol biopolymer transport system component